MRCVLLVILLSTCASSALARDIQLTTSAWLGLSGTMFDYEEFDDQDVSLDREEGWLPGVKGGLIIDNDTGFFETSLWLSTGEVDYSSPGVDTRTDEDISNLEVLVGGWFLTMDRFRASLIGGIGYRKWHRDIRSIETASGLNETYRWGYGVLGLRGEQTFSSETFVTFDLYLTRTINPEIEVDFDGLYDDVSLTLGEENGFRASFAVDWQLDTSLIVRLSPWYEYWELGRSADNAVFRNGVSVGTVFEPRSETQNIGVTVGVVWHFCGT